MLVVPGSASGLEDGMLNLRDAAAMWDAHRAYGP